MIAMIKGFLCSDCNDRSDHVENGLYSKHQSLPHYHGLSADNWKISVILSQGLLWTFVLSIPVKGQSNCIKCISVKL